MKIKYAAKTKVVLNAKEWDLLLHKKNCEQVAQYLNENLSQSINEAWEMIYRGSNYENACEHIHKNFAIVVEQYEDNGTKNIELQNVFKFLTGKLFDQYLVQFVVKKHPEYKSHKKTITM